MLKINNFFQDHSVSKVRTNLATDKNILLDLYCYYTEHALVSHFVVTILDNAQNEPLHSESFDSLTKAVDYFNSLL